MCADKPGIAKLPSSLHKLLPISVSCSCGRVHKIETRWADLHNGAIENLPDRVKELGSNLKIVLVVDVRTRQIAGNHVAELLNSAGHKTSFCQLPDQAFGRPHADEKNLEFALSAMEDADLAVAVGSGTCNDIAKLASYKKSIPYFVVATAPSMNGYTSGIAAIMEKGLKRTIECHGPMGVIADPSILTKAPGDLIAAGLGDLESKPTATSDFRLAGFIRGDYYCPAPERVVLEAEQKAADAAKAIGRRDPEGIMLLTEALLVSGLSMKLAGSSSPASGGEHLISHFWDMTAASQGRVEGWHGAQVGVTTIVTSTIYEVLQEMDPRSLDLDSLVKSWPGLDELRSTIYRIHGPMAEEVFSQAEQKHLNKREYRKELEFMVNQWTYMWDKVDDVLRPSKKIRSILESAKAPTNVHQLGLTEKHLANGVVHARQIRSRFTVLDLAAELGILHSRSDYIIKRSGCLGASS